MLDVLEMDYRIDEYTNEAKGIAFDTCHKIYVLMDDEQVELMRSYGYGAEEPEGLITSEQMTGDEMRRQVMYWYQHSCGLRFIQAVYSDKSIGYEGFVDIISQSEGFDDEDEDDD
jgi:hypothetical protein